LKKYEKQAEFNENLLDAGTMDRLAEKVEALNKVNLK